MSGATGAGSAGTSRGTETDGGGRGSATRAADPHTTQLRKIEDGATDSHSGSSSKTHSQGEL